MSKPETPKPTTPVVKPKLHEQACVTCNKKTDWDILYKKGKKGAVVTVLLQCINCGDTQEITATIHNLRNTFGIEKIDKLVGKLPL